MPWGKRANLVVHGDDPFNAEPPRAALADERVASLDELRLRFAQHEEAATLQCAGNRRVGFLSFRDIPGEAPWGPGPPDRGLGRRPLDRPLAAAGLEENADHVAFLGADVSEEPEPPQAFGASLPRHKATAEEVLVAWSRTASRCRRCTGRPSASSFPATSGPAASSGSSG